MGGCVGMNQNVRGVGGRGALWVPLPGYQFLL